MPDTRDERELLDRLQHVDALIDEVADPASQARLSEIVQTLLEFHNLGLQRILALLEQAPEARQKVIDAMCKDTLIAHLLILHGLHPRDLESRVRGALKKVEPYAASHGGRVELVSVGSDGVVQLRLEGSCHGCPSSRVTLQTSIEHEIYEAAPEVTAIEVEGLVEAPPPQPAGFVPVENLTIHGHAVQAAAS